MRYFKVLLAICLIFTLGIQVIAQGQEAKDSSELTDEEIKQYIKALQIVETEREEENTWPIIEEAFRSYKEGDRFFGITDLSRRARGIPESRSKIIPFLANVAMNDKYPRVRIRAMRAISPYTKMDIVVETIIKMLADEDKSNRREAFDKIVEKRITEAIPALKKTFAQKESGISKEEIEEAIAFLEERKKHPKEEDTELNRWIKQLEDPDPMERLFAVADSYMSLVVEEDEEPKVIEALLKAYKKETVRDNKIEMLAALSVLSIDMDDERVISLLKEETANEDEEIREIAEVILREMSIYDNNDVEEKE